jgi:hypothetical protein
VNSYTCKVKDVQLMLPTGQKYIGKIRVLPVLYCKVYLKGNLSDEFTRDRRSAIINDVKMKKNEKIFLSDLHSTHKKT